METLQQFLEDQENYYTEDKDSPVAEFVQSLGYGDVSTEEIYNNFIKNLSSFDDDNKLEALLDYCTLNGRSIDQLVKVLVESSDLECGGIREPDNTLFSCACGETEVEFDGEIHYLDLNYNVWRLIVDVPDAIERLENMLPHSVSQLVDAYKE